MLFVSLLFLVIAGPIVGVINHDPAVEEVAVTALRIISIGYVFYGVGMVLTNAFNGAGDSMTPLVIGLICFWAFQIPLAWTLAIRLGFGPKGVFIAIVITESCITIVSYILFQRGKWKRVKV